jgi:hypothetical protein
MKVRLVALVGLAIGFALPTFAQEKNAARPKGFSKPEPIITFDIPGGGTGFFQGTFAVDIDDFGSAIGRFVDANNVYHGFVRYPNGRVAIIDAPGAGATPGSFQGTLAWSINVKGTIAGQYQDSNYACHGFVRDPDGHITTFDAPGAGTGPNQGTLALDINLDGTIAGYTVDNNNVFHGFLRSGRGTFTSFDAPNAGTGPSQGTVVTPVSGLNSQGVTIGWYIDANYAEHGYLREQNGAIILFDPPSSIYTNPRSINPEGVIVGRAFANGILHGFVRSAKGVITTFDVPDAVKGTSAVGVTSSSLSTGLWADSSTIFHGFVRYPNGAILKFDAPGAGAVAEGQGTVPQGINFQGEIVGYLIDNNDVSHGFIRIP